MNQRDPAWIDSDVAYRAVTGRDPRYDGRLYLGVTSTGVFCRPSCPARTPRVENCRWFRSAAAAVAAGFRACRRCRPDALPGTRDWDVQADLVGRALRAIELGVVDEVGVDGLAARLHVSPRHLHRVIAEQMGVGPAQLARSRRAQLARHLLDESDLSMTEVAFAAGFASVRQFNTVIRETFAETPSHLRATRRKGPTTDRQPVDGARLTLQLRHRPPLDAEAWYQHVARRAVSGMERVEAGESGFAVERLVPGANGPTQITVLLSPAGARVTLELALPSLADLSPVVTAVRRWLDLDADPAVVGAALSQDRVLAPLVAAHPGLRVPGTVDGAELAIRAVVGQQVSVSAARTVAGRLVAAFGESGPGGLTSFPRPEVLVEAGPESLREVGLTGGRAGALHAMAVAIASGLRLNPAEDRAQVRAALLALPGVGPWTTEYVALRALGDPDAFCQGDLVLRQAMVRFLPYAQASAVTAREAHDRAASWRPWRGYAAQHLWTAMSEVQSP